MSERQPTLLAFAPMVNAEAARCVLEYYGIRYEEEDRFFGWANTLTLFHGGYGALPLLHAKGLHLSGPVPIVERFDPETRRARLLPPEEPLHGEVEREWKAFFPGLSSQVARFAYYHVLPQRELMIESFGAPIGKAERAALPLIYPAFRAALTKLLKLKPERIDEYRQNIDTELDRVDQRLAEHPYLVGDRLTLADIGMASASAPLLLPQHYAKWLPPVEQLPAPFAAMIEKTRARPCAAYVDRIYAEIAETTVH